MSKLIGYVTVHDEDGSPFTFAPGDDVPDWAVEKISNPNVWDKVESENPGGSESGDDKSKKAFSQLNKEELEALAATENVNIDGLETNKAIREAITTAREAK